jgi:hypothetical protein
MQPAVRRAGHSFLFVALCIFFDFADPVAPGAWSFDSNQSIDAASRARRSISLPNWPMSPPLRHIDPVEPATVRSPQPVVSAVKERTVPRRLGHPAAVDPPPDHEDQ